MTSTIRVALRSLLSALLLALWSSTAVSGTFIPPNGYVFDSSHQVLNDIVWMLGGSTASMVPGGRLGSYLRLFDTTQFTMHGGSLDSYVYAGDSSHFTMRGGNALSYVNAAQTSIIDIYGGNVSLLYLDDAGTINVYGRNFSPPVAPGGFGQVTGILADGTPLNATVNYLAGTMQAHLNLISIPESSSCVLAVLALGRVLMVRASRGTVPRFRTQQ